MPSPLSSEMLVQIVALMARSCKDEGELRERVYAIACHCTANVKPIKGRGCPLSLQAVTVTKASQEERKVAQCHDVFVPNTKKLAYAGRPQVACDKGVSSYDDSAYAPLRNHLRLWVAANQHHKEYRFLRKAVNDKSGYLTLARPGLSLTTITDEGEFWCAGLFVAVMDLEALKVYPVVDLLDGREAPFVESCVSPALGDQLMRWGRDGCRTPWIDLDTFERWYGAGEVHRLKARGFILDRGEYDGALKARVPPSPRLAGYADGENPALAEALDAVIHKGRTRARAQFDDEPDGGVVRSVVSSQDCRVAQLYAAKIGRRVLGRAVATRVATLCQSCPSGVATSTEVLESILTGVRERNYVPGARSLFMAGPATSASPEVAAVADSLFAEMRVGGPSASVSEVHAFVLKLCSETKHVMVQLGFEDVDPRDVFSIEDTRTFVRVSSAAVGQLVDDNGSGGSLSEQAFRQIMSTDPMIRNLGQIQPTTHVRT